MLPAVQKIIRAGRGGDYSLYENFGRYPNSFVLSGQSPLLGPAWGTTGGSLPTTSGGQLTNSGLGYAYANLRNTPQVLGAKLSFSGGTTLSQQNFAMAFSSQAPGALSIKNLVHLNFGPQLFTLGVFDGSATFTPLMTNSWAVPMSNDSKLHEVYFGVIGQTVVVVGPSGDVYACSDPNFATNYGPMVFWEPFTEADGLTCGVSLAYAVNNRISFPGTDRFNPNDNEGGLTLSNGNRTATATSSTGSAEVRGIAPRTNGKVYFEGTWVNVQSPTSTAIGLGIASLTEHTLNPSVGIGGDVKSLAFFASTGTSAIFQGNAISANFGSGMGPANGTVYGFAIDFGAAKIWVKNLTSASGWNNDILANQNPATATGGAAITAGGQPFAIGLQMFTSGDVVTINMGGSSYTGTPPAGFVNWLV